MPISFYEIPIASCGKIFADGVQKIKGQVDMDEHVGIFAPLHQAGALRKLMPDHAGFPVLILKNELEFLPSPVILPRSQQGANGDHSISGEKPVILRTPGLARGTVSCDD